MFTSKWPSRFFGLPSELSASAEPNPSACIKYNLADRVEFLTLAGLAGSGSPRGFPAIIRTLDRADGIKGSASPLPALARYPPFRIDESNRETRGSRKAIEHDPWLFRNKNHRYSLSVILCFCIGYHAHVQNNCEERRSPRFVHPTSKQKETTNHTDSPHPNPLTC